MAKKSWDRMSADEKLNALREDIAAVKESHERLAVVVDSANAMLQAVSAEIAALKK